MVELNKEDILKNKVETINQFYVLQYLKKELNIYEFKIFLYDRNTIKVIDKDNHSVYFTYENDKVIFQEEIKNNEQEMII